MFKTVVLVTILRYLKDNYYVVKGLNQGLHNHFKFNSILVQGLADGKKSSHFKKLEQSVSD
jgi:hypothetical protein